MSRLNTYFLEKSASLMQKLITGQGTAKQRLLDCEIEFGLTFSIPISTDLEPIRTKIIQELNQKKEIRIGETAHSTSFRKTLYSTRNASASKIIGEIYNLYKEIEFIERHR
jgi:hypothetical protein